MRTNNKILKISEVRYPDITFISRNGEHRKINLRDYFRKISLGKRDFGYELIRDPELFKTVELENNALAWKKLSKEIKLPGGTKLNTYFHLDPVMTIENSVAESFETNRQIGVKLRYLRKELQLSQEELAAKIGSTKHYISKVENARTDIELKTLQKIFEVGLNKKVFITVYDYENPRHTLSDSCLKPVFLEWAGKHRDELTLIEGIGPKIRDFLKKHKIKTSSELANLDFKVLMEWLSESGKTLDFYASAETWIMQAKLQSAGE